MFAKRLRDLRESKNLQQKDIANELEVLEATISMWETGKRIPYSDMLVKIANYFDVSVDYLLGNDKEISDNEKKLKEKETLKNALKNAGYMKDNEVLSDNELDRLMKFIVNNKDLLKGKK